MQVLICFDRTLSPQPQPPIHPLLAGQSPPLEPVYTYSLLGVRVHVSQKCALIRVSVRHSNAYI